MLAIFTTLSEAVGISARHPVLLIALSLLDFIPHVLNAFVPHLAHQPIGNPLIPLEIFAASVSWVVVIAIKSAVILGVLQNSGHPVSAAITSVQANTWTLVCVKFYLGVLAILALIPVGLIFRLLINYGAKPFFETEIMAVLRALVYIVFIKYALVDPLVVIEKLNSRSAINRSWQITQGRFGYTVGCICAVAVLNLAAAQALRTPQTVGPFDNVPLLHVYFLSLTGCFSTVVAWCLYWRLRAQRITLNRKGLI